MQLFFDDALSQQVYASGVYASKGPPDQANASDGIFNQSGGATLLNVAQDGDTYQTTFARSRSSWPRAAGQPRSLSAAIDRRGARARAANRRSRRR